MKSKHTLRRPAISLCVFILFSFSTPGLVMASHTAGGEISYTHISGSNYNIQFVFFRDCFGIPAPTSVTLAISSVTCNVNQTFTMIPVPGTGIDVALPCQGTMTTCTGGQEQGTQKWEYAVDVAVPGQCPDWVFSVTICCRNYATTITGTSDLYIEARLNNATGDNTSPQFTNDPFITACTNQDFHYNNGMFDAEGDSLAYSLIAGRSGPNSFVNYVPPHTAQQPFISVPPVTFDYFTGDFIMHPTAQEVGPVVYEIRDYRNGELMGSVMREIMMYTQPCADLYPTATEMNGTSQQIAYVFPNDTICFDIFSDDPDITDSLTMTWNQVIPAATFTTAGALHPTGTFCWIPSLNDVRSQPYMFTAMIRDNYCPRNNAGVYSYYIYVTLDSSLVFLNTNDPGTKDLFTISPNPSQGIFVIQSAQQFIRMKIYNPQGSCILNKDFESSIDLSGQPAGVYIVEATTLECKVMRLKLLKN